MAEEFATIVLGGVTGSVPEYAQLRSGATVYAQDFPGTTREQQIDAAITDAVSRGYSYCWVPANMLPYDGAAVTFDTSVRMIREGGNPGVYDITAYGAGGGLASYDSIQAALNAASGGIVVVPYDPLGNYLVDTLLVAQTLTTIIGLGGRIEITAAISGIGYAMSATRIRYKGLKIKGAATGVTSGLIAVSLPSDSEFSDGEIDTFNIGMQIEGDNSAVEDNVIQNILGTGSAQGYGTLVLGADAVVRDNHYKNVNRHAVYVSGHATFSGGQRALVEGNQAHLDSLVAGGSGVKVSATTGQGTLTGVRVLGNSLRFTNVTALGVGIEFVEDVTESEAVGNYVQGTESQALRVAATASFAPKRIQFASNVVKATAGFFIRVENIGGQPEDCQFIGNITDRDGVSTITDDGIRTIIRGAGEYGDSYPEYTLSDLTAPSVYKGTHFVCTPAGATTITDLVNGREGQTVWIRFTNGNATFQDAPNFVLAGGANFVGSADDVLVLQRRGSLWYEISRSVN